jgi:hypothetical protein
VRRTSNSAAGDGPGAALRGDQEVREKLPDFDLTAGHQMSVEVVEHVDAAAVLLPTWSEPQGEAR